MFEFVEENVLSETTAKVRGALEQGKGCLVTGTVGSGKSHAVRAAVNGAVWVNLDDGGFQLPRFFVDLARQVDMGPEILEKVAHQQLDEATELADEALKSRCLVVDRAERLVHDASQPWDDPLQRLSAGQNAVLTKWLCRRSETPTVLLSRRKLADWGSEPIIHTPPRSWPLKLAHASDGYRDWHRLSGLIDDRPGGMTLARAVVPLTGPREFHRLLDQGDELVDEAGRNEVLRLLARTVAERAPMAWRRVLTLVGELDGAPVGTIESILDADDRPALASLRRIHLVEDRKGRLTVLPMLRDFAGLALEPDNRDELLSKAAHYLLTRVNDPQTLDPLDADSVFRAHTLFVRGGDFTNARRTARLHAGGLISLAKRTSLERDWAEARRLYDSILELLEHKRSEPASVHGRHTRSYVVHYRGYNDERVNRSSSVQALSDYTRSIELWPENALWRQHQIEAFIYRGNLRCAKDSIDGAYASIGEHPRRDTLLRIRPARTAVKRGAPVFALEVIEGVDVSFEQDPDGADLLTQIENEWADGVLVPSLPRTRGELIFRRPVTVSVKKRSQQWRAQFHDFHGKPGRGQTALAALRHLADQLGDEAHELLSTPTHLLEDDDVVRKSEIIAHLDPLNSDIGLEHASHRWLMGRIENGAFVPLQRTDFDAIPLPSEVRGNHGEHGEYMAKVQVYRDGRPKGAVEQLRPAGSGRPLAELLAELNDLRGAGPG